MVVANPKFTQGLLRGRGGVPPKLPEFPEMMPGPEDGAEGEAAQGEGAGSEPGASSGRRQRPSRAAAPSSSSSSSSPRYEAKLPPLLSAHGGAAPSLPRLPRRLGTGSDEEELDDSPFGFPASSACASSARDSLGPPSSRQGLRPSLRRAITVINSVVPQDEDGYAGRRREELGELPTVGGAAQARRARAACPQLEQRIRFQRLERSDLCAEGRAAVRNWALGHISGQQCLLRLELCPSVAKLLGKELPEQSEGATPDEDPEVERIALWAVGCVRLGGSDPRLEVLRQELEERPPSEVLRSAYEEVERECGAEGGDHMDADEINWDWAFQRIAMRASRSRTADPGAFVRMQVWREVLRVHLGVSDAEDFDDTGGDAAGRQGGGSGLDDASILDWLRRSQEQVRERARQLSFEALAREADRMLSYVTQTIQMAACLREALEGLQRFDAYKIIGVRKGASRSEVRRAFYKKALLVHPDKGGDKAAFQELQRAYDEILRELDGKGEEEEEEEEAATGQDSDDSDEEEDRWRRRQERSKEAQQGGDRGGEGPGEEQEAGDGPGAEGAPAAEEELSKGRLGWFARAALDAAEGAGECATECLRHCRAARDALEDEPPDWDTGCENTEVALAAAQAVAEAGRLVAGLTQKVSAALEDALEALEPQDAGLPEAEPAHLATLRHAATSTGEAFKAVELSVELCNQAEAEASAAAEGPFFGGSAAADRLSDAVDELARAAKQLAVAALDAAEAAAEAARSCKGLLDDLLPGHGQAGGAEGSAEAEEGAEADGAEAEGPGAGPDEAEEEQQSQAPPEPTEAEREAKRLKAAEAQRLLRSHQSLSTLLEAVRMLGCTNKELLKLQHSAQALTFQRAGRLPSVLQLRGLRAMQLLAEFLDEAALASYAALLELWRAVPGRQRSARAFQDVVIRAVESSFAFILKSSPDLAVPLDPRAQTLRVALALDPTAASEMVLMQASQRLQASVMSVILEAEGSESSDQEVEEEEEASDLHGAGRLAIHRMEQMLGQALSALAQADRDPNPKGRPCERNRSF